MTAFSRHKTVLCTVRGRPFAASAPTSRNPDCVGFSIWQMNDGRTRERFDPKAVSSFFGGSLAGVFDQMRRPKMSLATVRDYFTNRTPASLGQGR